MFYNNPYLIYEMVEFLKNYMLKTLKKALKEIEFDVYLLYEDTARIIKFVLLDTDGNFKNLIPLYLKAGIDCFSPME